MVYLESRFGKEFGIMTKVTIKFDIRHHV